VEHQREPKSWLEWAYPCCCRWRAKTNQRVHFALRRSSILQPVIRRAVPGGRSAQSAKHHKPIAGLRTDVTQGGERPTIAAVRRRRQEAQAAWLAECRHSRVTIAVVNDSMR
jgi:hypothetical protein